MLLIVQGMLQAAQQAHQALQHALVDRSSELAKAQEALKCLQTEAADSHAATQAQAQKLQQQLHTSETMKAEACVQVRQLTAALATASEEHQVTFLVHEQTFPDTLSVK